jgi:hypothetical protein
MRGDALNPRLPFEGTFGFELALLNAAERS